MKFDHKDILILGDSFCHEREAHTDWPMIVGHKFTGQYGIARGYGFSGGAWWSVRKLLLSELKIYVPKVLIICHTEPSRIPNDKDYGITASILSNGVLTLHGEHRSMDFKAKQKITKAAMLYYEELWSNEFCQWTQEKWFQELDNLVEFYQIPYVIHLPCFENTGNYIFRNGITVKEKLYSWAGCPENPYLSNHLTEFQNEKLAARLIDLLLNYQPGLQELDVI